jgi:hypothetical protein
MKCLLLAAATFVALTVLPIVAHASIVETYECRAAKSNPPDNDRDPIYKSKLQIVIAAGSNEFRTFTVDHYAASGKVFSREDQYRDRRYWSNDSADSWSGTSVKKPDLTMIGSLKNVGRNRLIYVEKQFRAGKLETIVTSVCRPLEEESH